MSIDVLALTCLAELLIALGWLTRECLRYESRALQARIAERYIARSDRDTRILRR